MTTRRQILITTTRFEESASVATENLTLETIRAENDWFAVVRGVTSDFPDGETCVEIGAEIDGADVLICHSIYDTPSDPKSSVNQAMMELIITSHGCLTFGAHSISVYMPFTGYTRQDRVVHEYRRPPTAELVAAVLRTSGVNHLITIASGQPRMVAAAYARGAPALQVHTLDPAPSLADHLNFRGIDPTVVVAPDSGAAELATRVARRLEADTPPEVINLEKFRLGPETVVHSGLQEETTLDAADVLLVDDLVASGATVESAIDQLRLPADSRVHLAVTHMRLTEAGIRRITRLLVSRKVHSIVSLNPVGSPDYELRQVSYHSPRRLLRDAVQTWMGSNSQRLENEGAKAE